MNIIFMQRKQTAPNALPMEVQVHGIVGFNISGPSLYGQTVELDQIAFDFDRFDMKGNAVFVSRETVHEYDEEPISRNPYDDEGWASYHYQ